MSDLAIGQPLPWNVYDAAGQLLLSKGHIVERTTQLEALIERGMFADAQAIVKKPPPEKPKELPSVLRLINLANKRLETLLINLPNETDAQPKLLEVSRALIYATTLDPDVALASILLNQSVTDYPIRHCVDTAIVSLLVARSMSKPQEEVEVIAAASLTMNVAMLRLQEKLQNSADPLTEDELRQVRDHPVKSAEQLQRAGVISQIWLDCVLMHHENEDGSGYPYGKAGADIPISAKIIGISDRYCARVSSRQYRKSLLPNAALRDILLSDKKNIDPLLTTTFIRELGIYPTGTFVRLENGEIGVVTSRGSSSTTPYVHALVGPRGAPLAMPIKRDTSKKLYAIRDVLREDEADIRFNMQQIWGATAAL
jgi:HD-GYP domain-containing protein (c-di-GMP phosphodiesterase class II)